MTQKSLVKDSKLGFLLMAIADFAVNIRGKSVPLIIWGLFLAGLTLVLVSYLWPTICRVKSALICLWNRQHNFLTELRIFSFSLSV